MANCNLRTQFERIITRAGVSAWPKLFVNLRSSRQTELSQTYPSYVVCRWMGNSREVADKHYNQVTDEHDRLAAAPKKAAPNPALHDAESSKIKMHLAANEKMEMSKNGLKQGEMTMDAAMCNEVQKLLMGLGRLELPTSPLSAVRSSQLSYKPDAVGG